MCPFDEKKEKSVAFSLTYKYQKIAYTIFSTPSNSPYYSNPPSIINNYYNVQPLLLFRTRKYVKSALLMISLTSIKTCSSSD